MSNFLTSLKSDLLDRRFLPILTILGVALLAALAYVALGGSSSGPSTPAPSAAATVAPSTATGAVTIVKAPETATTKAAAETTSGAPHSSGAPRDPFKPLPGTKTASSQSSSSSSSSSSAAGKSASSAPSSSSSPSSAGGSTTTSTTPAAPAPTHSSAPAKPHKIVTYKVTLQFGVVPAGTPEGTPAPAGALQTYTDIKLGEALPKNETQLTFEGGSGSSAKFALSGESILHGAATCKPSPAQCETLLLAAGQSETFEVIADDEHNVTYELKVVSVEKSTTTSTATTARTARAHAARRHHRRHRHHGR